MSNNQTYRIKICCHKPGVPEICEVIEIPFKPEEGDVICVRPPNAKDEWARITVLVNNLIFDATEGYFVMRPDIISSLNKQLKGPDIVHDNGDLIV